MGSDSRGLQINEREGLSLPLLPIYSNARSKSQGILMLHMDASISLSVGKRASKLTFGLPLSVVSPQKLKDRLS